MIELLRHDSRVYSIWVNGKEDFYFKATSADINELVKLYGQIPLRDHVVIIRQRPEAVKTFDGVQVDYNVTFHYLGGIVLGMMRREDKAETYEPTLTIFVDPQVAEKLANAVVLPDTMVVESEVSQWPPQSHATRPQRKLWHAAVNFDNKQPAADFENGLATTVTLWKDGSNAGYDLGYISHDGLFHAAFSADEIAQLKAGTMWLTLTVGKPLTKAAKDDARLPIDRMSTDPSQVKSVEVAKPAG